MKFPHYALVVALALLAALAMFRFEQRVTHDEARKDAYIKARNSYKRAAERKNDNEVIFEAERKDFESDADAFAALSKKYGDDPEDFRPTSLATCGIVLTNYRVEIDILQLQRRAEMKNSTMDIEGSLDRDLEDISACIEDGKVISRP